MIQQLNWPTIEARRRSSDLVLMYKVVHNLLLYLLRTIHLDRQGIWNVLDLLHTTVLWMCTNIQFSHELLYCGISYQNLQ